MDEFEKFYNRALRFLSYRPRSEKEIRDKLISKKASEKIIKEVIKKLKAQKFIDDEEFAKWWVEQRTSVQPRSIRLIKIELRRKGVVNDLIESRIKNQESRKDDLDRAKKLLQRRIARLKNLPKEKAYQKLGRYLATKGFDWETIKKSIDEVLGKRV